MKKRSTYNLIFISFLLTVLGCLISTISVRGQACGASTYAVSAYTRLGTQAHNVHYNIYPLRKKSSSNIPYHNLLEMPSQTYTAHRPANVPAVYVENSSAESFLATYKEDDFDHMLHENGLGKNQFSGSPRDGTITFFTMETDTTPYLLSITGDDVQPIYLLDNFFGGCRRQIDLILYSR